MKASKRNLFILLYIVGLFIIVPRLDNGLVSAEELKGSTGGSLNALDSGYAITRWPWNGGEIYAGESATVRACTTQYPKATRVVFRWYRPDGTHFDVGPKPLTNSSDTWDGKPIWDANDTQTLDMVGDWGVQALFMDDKGRLQGPDSAIVKIRAISWHVVPEAPVGTITTILCMFGALGILALYKNRF